MGTKGWKKKKTQHRKYNNYQGYYIFYSRIYIFYYILFQDPHRRKQWQNALGRLNALNEKEVVCELHFKTSDVQRFYKTILPDGSKVLMEKGRINLANTAIPIPQLTLVSFQSEMFDYLYNVNIIHWFYVKNSFHFPIEL